MKKERKEYIQSCEISEIVSVGLGGFEQKILIEGQKKNSPLVLFLHGGPGFPAPFCVGARGLFPEITKKFTAVYWDQLGCGINNRRIGNEFSIASFVQMTLDLIRFLKERFKNAPLYVFAVSWGSVLSAAAASEMPEAIAGVFAAGQIVLPPMLSDKTFEAIKKSAAPARVKEKLKAVRASKQPTPQEIALLSKTVRKYTNAYGIRDKSSPAENPVKEIFASRDYRFCDKIACFHNGYAKNRSLLKELSAIDLTAVLSDLKIPYHIYGGDCDLVTAAEEAEALVNGAQNQNLSFRSFANEGHVPSDAVCKEIFAELEEAAGV